MERDCIRVDTDQEPCYSPQADECVFPELSADGHEPTTADIIAATLDITVKNATGVVLPIQDFHEMLAEALAYLRANLDLVEYACCLYFGPDGAPNPGMSQHPCQCVIDALQGSLDFTIEPPQPDGRGGFLCNQIAADNLSGSDIINFASQLDPALWGCTPLSGSLPARDANLAAGDVANALCDTLELAATILHELMHGCLQPVPSFHTIPNQYSWLGGAAVPDELQRNCDLVNFFAINTSTLFSQYEDWYGMMAARFELPC